MDSRRSPFRHFSLALFRAARAMMNAHTPRDGAAISYFALFALFPAVLVLIAIADAILGWLGLLHKGVVERIVAFFPVSRQFLEANFNQMIQPPMTLVLSCLAVVIWTATWVFSFVEDSMNRAWGVQGRRTFWESRIRSIGVVALGGTILLSSACLTAVVSKAGETIAIPTFTNQLIIEAQIINWLWSTILLASGFLLAILVFFCVYKLIPYRKVAWIEAITAALVAALLWELGSFIFVHLLPFFDYERVYGRLGAIIALLAWVYTSNMILLFGANFSAQLHKPDSELEIEEDDDLGTPRWRVEEKVRSFPHARL